MHIYISNKITLVLYEYDFFFNLKFNYLIIKLIRNKNIK